MAGKEFDTPQEIGVIRERLLRSRSFRDQAIGRQDSSKGRLLDKIFRPFALNAKSEYFIPPDDIGMLIEKVDGVRNWIFEYGQDFTHHPEYQRMSHEWETPEFAGSYSAAKYQREKFTKLYWYRAGPIEARAEKEPGHPADDEIRDVLRLMYQDKDMRLTIAFGWNNDFSLIVAFEDEKGDLDDTVLEYSTFREPLNTMTQEECNIITYYLDQYIQQAQTPLPPSPSF